MVEDHPTCCFFLYFRDSHKYNLPLCFNLAHRRAGFSSMFDRVPLSLPKVYVSWTQMFYLSKTQGQTTISTIYVFFNSQTASHLSMFTVLLIHLPLLTVPDGRSRLVHAAVMAEQTCTILYPYTIVHLGPVLQCLQKLSGTWPMG